MVLNYILVGYPCLLSKHVFGNNNCWPLNVPLYYISCPDGLSRWSLCQLLFSVVREDRMQEYFQKMLRLSNEYDILEGLEVTSKRKWFWDLFFITSVHSSTRQLALFWRLTKFRIGWSDGWFCKLNKNFFFRKFLLKAHYYPAYMTD